MEQVSTRVAEYSVTEAALAELAKRFKGATFEVTTRDGLKLAKAARMELRTLRTSLEAKRVAIKRPLLEQVTLIDGEAKRITRELAALEDPIDLQIKTQERIEDERRQAVEQAERDRLAAEARALKEAEEKKLADERARLAAAQKLLDEDRAKLDADRKAQQDKADAEDRERRARIDAEERAAAQRIAEAEAKAKAERQAEEDRLRAERLRLEDEQRARDAEARRLREAEEARAAAVKREAERKAHELMDARQMLVTFRERFGHLEQFETVVAEIDACLAVPA